MEVLKLSAFAIVSVVLIVLIKQEKKEIGLVIGIAGAVIVAAYGILKLDEVINLLYSLVTKTRYKC